jgi:TonB family protein
MADSPNIPDAGAPSSEPWPVPRRFPRKSITEPETVAVDLGAWGKGLVIDVGEGGVGVQTLVPLNPGTASDVRFELPGANTYFQASALVAWVGPAGRAGIQFVNISEQSRALLRQWISGTPDGGAVCGPQRQSGTTLQRLAEYSLGMAGADGIAIAIGSPLTMRCQVSIGNAPDLGALVTAESGLSGLCLRTAQVVRCDDTESDPRVDPAVCRQLKIRSVLIVPILAAGRLVGLLEAFSSTPQAFDTRDQERLVRISELIPPLLNDSDLKTTPEPGQQLLSSDLETKRDDPDNRGSAAQADAGISASAAEPVEAPVGHRTALPPVPLQDEGDALEIPPPQTRRQLVLKGSFVLVLLAAMFAAGWYVARWRVRQSLKVAARVTPPAVTEAPALDSDARNTPRISQSPSQAPELVASKPESAAEPVPLPPVPQLSAEPPAIVSRPKPAGSPERAIAAARVTAEVVSVSVPALSRVADSATKPKLVPGKLLRKVDAQYPRLAGGISGNVVLRATVSSNGAVDNIRLVSGSELLTPAAMSAVSQWRYEPYRLADEPVEAEITILMKFTAATLASPRKK